MPVLVPYPIETARSALIDVPQERHVLRLVLGDDEQTTRMRDCTGMPRQFVDDVLGRAIVDRVDGIEAEAVEMVLVDPVPHVGAHECPHRLGMLTVKVEAASPFRFVLGEIPVAVLVQDAPDWPEMVVDDIENHSYPETMGIVDEHSDIV